MILITGGLGYIGAHIAFALMSQGHPVVIVDNLSNAKLEMKGRLEQLLGRAINFVRLDVRNTPALQRVFEENAIQIVIHCAGKKANIESSQQPLDHYNDNVVSLVSVLRVMQRTSVQHLVYTGSATVYGEQNTTAPLQESVEGLPTTPYSRSLKMCEQILHDYTATENYLRVAILRCFNVAGAHPSGLIGDFPNVMTPNLFNNLAQSANDSEPSVDIYGNSFATPDGTAVRDYVHILDVVKAHLLSLDYIFNTPQTCSTFNIGSGKGTSNLELVKAFNDELELDIDARVIDSRTNEVGAVVADTNLATKTLNFTAEFDLAKMIEDTNRFMKSFKY